MMPNVFFSYSHADEALRDQLEQQLAILKRQGIINTWHDRKIDAGQELGKVIDQHIEQDEIILLLVSPSFLASDYCYDIEMKRALERHEAGEAIVIPVILRMCEWQEAPFGKLKLLATPRDGLAITKWPDRDEAFLQVAQEVRKAAKRWASRSSVETDKNMHAVVNAASSQPTAPPLTPGTAKSMTAPLGPRSSNLRVAKTFTQRDLDVFLQESFEFISLFMENTLREFGNRNPDYEGVFRRIDANRFFVTVYKNGKDVARATIYMGGMFGPSINYVQGETTQSNSINESLTVGADDQMLYLSSHGMSSYNNDSHKKLTPEGASELLWEMIIAPLQQSSRQGRF
ncbi:MAG: toll/interleukin-1 receptor domain-containing protein [Xylophilus ampelinus]